MSGALPGVKPESMTTPQRPQTEGREREEVFLKTWSPQPAAPTATADSISCPIG